MLFAVGCLPLAAIADDSITTTNSWTPQNSRFGLLDGLDHRSAYYQDCFPTPVLVDETSLETEGELQINSLHTQVNADRSDIVTAEVEKSLGLVTFELEVPYENDWDENGISQGIGNIGLNLRCPFYQYVSAGRFFDTTVGASLDAGIPVSAAISRNAELDPAIFDDLKLGDHFTLQSILGYSTTFGGGDDGGLRTFEYGFDFACAIPHSELPLPCVTQFTPMFELSSETGLNKDESGQNSLLGSIGFRIAFKPIGDTDITLGIGYIFPMDNTARAEVHWGLASSLTFDF